MIMVYYKINDDLVTCPMHPTMPPKQFTHCFKQGRDTENQWPNLPVKLDDISLANKQHVSQVARFMAQPWLSGSRSISQHTEVNSSYSHRQRV